MEKFKSIKVLMFTYFGAIMTFGLVVMGISLYEKFNHTARAYASESVEQLVTQVKYSLDTYTQGMIDVSNTIYYKIIKNQNINEHTFIQQMNVIQMTNKDIAGLAIFKGNGELVAATRYATVHEDVDVTSEVWFENALKRPENVHFSSPYQQEVFKGQEPWVVSLSRAVSLNQGGSIVQGVLLVDMNLTGIKNICNPIAEGESSDIYIITPEGESVYAKNDIETLEAMFGPLEALEDGRTILEKEKLIRTVQTAGYTGWKIIGIWQLDKLLFNFNQMQVFFIIILISVLILFMIGSFLISSRLTSPLYKLQKSMKQVEAGNFDIQLEEDGEYVVSELSKTFNTMVRRIKTLMDAIVKEQDSKRKKEMEVLQSQINPHFLYNTLDSIVWLIEDERSVEATQMITSLSRFFRISISKGRHIITVREELEHARSYLDIQKIRYKNKFEYTIQASDEVMNALTLKLILQPLLENALYHGIEYAYHRGHILIKVNSEGEDLFFTIQDNGAGMTQEVKDKLFDSGVKLTTKGSGVGVRNVNQRIQLYYGEIYGMTVKSALEEGTIITIKIPLIKA